MIFSCNTLDLADALSKISLALPQRKLSAILEGIKMEAEGDFVKLTTTNMDFTIIKLIKADVKMSGEVLVPGKIFEEYMEIFLFIKNNIKLIEKASKKLYNEYLEIYKFLVREVKNTKAEISKLVGDKKEITEDLQNSIDGLLENLRNKLEEKIKQINKTGYEKILLYLEQDLFLLCLSFQFYLYLELI